MSIFGEFCYYEQIHDYQGIHNLKNILSLFCILSFERSSYPVVECKSMYNIQLFFSNPLFETVLGIFECIHCPGPGHCCRWEGYSTLFLSPGLSFDQRKEQFDGDEFFTVDVGSNQYQYALFWGMLCHQGMRSVANSDEWLRFGFLCHSLTSPHQWTLSSDLCCDR